MMIFKQFRMIVAGAIIFALVSFGVYAKHLWNKNQELRRENEILAVQVETNETNLKLVVQHLDREAELRLQAEEALNALLKEVPNEEYSQALPPNIQRVVDNFHSSIGHSAP